MFPTVVVAKVMAAATDPPNTTSLLVAHAPVKGPLALVPQSELVQAPPVPAWFQYTVAALASLDQPNKERAVNVAIASFLFLIEAKQKWRVDGESFIFEEVWRW
jgi:hypothetical protein